MDGTTHPHLSLWRGRHWASYVCAVLWMLSMFAATSDAAVGLGKNVAVEILHMENVTDMTMVTVFVFFSYMMQYSLFGFAFEMTNPRGFNSVLISAAEGDRRWAQVKQEIRLGFGALMTTVTGTIVWMYFVEPHTWFYGYFETHEFNLGYLLVGFVVYTLVFDTWFFWTHLLLHKYNWLWDNVHFVHHQIKNPSAFAQFAVHPVEAAIQGPLGHYLCTLCFPMHPVALSAFGFFFSAWAVAAHDGRQLDIMSHYYHHSKGRGRKHYFNLAFIYPFWDWWNGTRWSAEHPMWVEWETKRGTKLFDTHDGTKAGANNDRYGAIAAEPGHVGTTPMGIANGKKAQ